MTKVTIISSPHSKEYDEVRASHMAKERFDSYFMELIPGIVEQIGTNPNFETSYNFAKENNIPIHFVDNKELNDKHTFVDRVADRVAFSILRYHLKNAGYDIQRFLTGDKFVEEDGKEFDIVDTITPITNKAGLKNTLDLLSTAYQASYGCIRERSSSIAKNTDSEIRKNGYNNSVLECGSAHKDIADMLKEKHDVELIALGDGNLSNASIVANRELGKLQRVNHIELPQDVRDKIFNMRRLDREAYMRFICREIPFGDSAILDKTGTLRETISDIYMK